MTKNQDVKALPVAWVDDLTKPQPHCVTDLRYRSAADADAGKAYTPVVRQSDAESALAELRAEVERLSARVRDLLDQRQESAEKHSAYHDRLMNHIEQLMSRADTAEARLAEVKRAIADLMLYFKSGNSIPVEKATIKADSPEIVTLAAFLGEGNG